MRIGEKLNQYITDVLTGKKLACKWEKLAVERFENDCKNPLYEFNKKEAAMAVSFIQNLELIEGEWVGEKFILQGWQLFIVCNIFGLYYKNTDRRKHNKATVIVPRKNGKSPLAAAIGLYYLYINKDGSPQVYSAATKLQQAKVVFNHAFQMASKCEPLKKISRLQNSVNHSQILNFENNGIFKPLEYSPNTQDGFNVSCGILDEYHAAASDEQYEILNTATGSRLNSLILIISTEGYNGAESPFGKHRSYCQNVLEKTTKDEGHFVIIYSIDDGDDWTSLDARKKANPNFGISVKPEKLEEELIRAMLEPVKEMHYKTKFLNLKGVAEVGWIGSKDYQKNNIKFDLSILNGQNCYVGLDLASSRDLTALVLKFKINEKYYNIYKFYLPLRAAESRSSDTRQMFFEWEKNGLITLTSKFTTDYDQIMTDLKMFLKKYNILGVGYDPFNSSHFINLLGEIMDADKLIPVNQTIGYLSQPTKALEADILEGINYNNCNPLQEWQYGNVVLRVDDMGNIKPAKNKSKDKIDGVVAEVMAKAIELHFLLENDTKELSWFKSIEF